MLEAVVWGLADWLLAKLDKWNEKKEDKEDIEV
jgi:hypothetical protein